jgi:hypothetical protein
MLVEPSVHSVVDGQTRIIGRSNRSRIPLHFATLPFAHSIPLHYRSRIPFRYTTVRAFHSIALHYNIHIVYHNVVIRIFAFKSSSRT